MGLKWGWLWLWGSRERYFSLFLKQFLLLVLFVVVAFPLCPFHGKNVRYQQQHSRVTRTMIRYYQQQQEQPRGISSQLNVIKKIKGQQQQSLPPYLLPDPMNNAIGNFFEERNDDSMSFIQCYMLAVGMIDGHQYGVGFPIDMPVMLTYFEGNELMPVRPDYPDYDHLINHVSVQMDFNECQLYKTPIVLTLQGEFEDEEMNSIPGIDDYLNEDNSDIDYDDDDNDDESEEISVEELIRMEGIDDDDDDDDNDIEGDEDMSYVDEDADYDDDEEDYLEDDDEYDDDGDDDDESLNENMGSFWSSSPAGKLDEKYTNAPDMSIARGSGDLSDVPKESFVTQEDTKSLRKAHKRADRIIEYAADVALIASFHHKKKNYHLVKLLEPIFIIGKRIDDIKGYYFTLLDDKEGEQIVPILEDLLAKKRMEPPTPDMLAALKESTNDNDDNRLQERQNQGRANNDKKVTGTNSRRGWRNRKK